MQISSDLMRLLLLACMLSMMALAALYLRRRALSPLAYMLWGLAAILIPLVGPFLVIWLKPGGNHPRSQP